MGWVEFWAFEDIVYVTLRPVGLLEPSHASTTLGSISIKSKANMSDRFQLEVYPVVFDIWVYKGLPRCEWCTSTVQLKKYERLLRFVVLCKVQ